MRWMDDVYGPGWKSMKSMRAVYQKLLALIRSLQAQEDNKDGK